MTFLETLHALARSAPKHVVLAEATDPRVLEAAGIIVRDGLARVTLLGSPDELRRVAQASGLRLPDAAIADPASDPRLDSYVHRFVELRAKKGMTPDAARAALLSPTCFAAMMVERGDGDATVSGSLSPTADVVRAAILIIRPAEGISTVSGCSVMILTDPTIGEQGVLIFADTGVVPDPTPEQLADIALSTVTTFRSLLDAEPRVAMVSFSTRGSASHPLIEKVRRATRIAQERAPGVAIDGELQVDAALIPEVARRKLADSHVAGRANILIFPSLDVANVAYKLTERLAKARALGPVLQGLRKPASDLSRGCSARDIVDVAALVAVQAVRPAQDLFR